MDARASTSRSDSTSFKVVLLGEGAVGKTSLMLRYVENKFNPRHISTLQASFSCKKITVDGKKIELNIWDTAGQERFHSLGPIYYRGSNGALLIYDITDEHSFEKVKLWVKELQRMLGDSVVLMIVGNKTDLSRSRNVESDVAMEYARSVGAEYAEASAKENIGIDQIFDRLTREMIVKDFSRAEAAAKSPIQSSARGSDLLIIDDQPKPTKRCC